MAMEDIVSAASAGTHDLGDGLVVNRLGYGAMRITGAQVWGPPEDIDLAIRVLRRATELGVNFIDTADSYGPSISEELIAEALAGYGDVVVATKGGLRRPTAPEWTNDARPEHLRMALDGSLKRLRVERIDLYQLHAPDPDVPYEESIGALKEMQDAGKIRLIGVSNVDLDELEIARGIVDVVSVQNRYNLIDRSSDDVLDRCEELGIAFLPWFPLATGDLAEGGRRGAGKALKRIAERHDATPAQVALAWLLARSPIVIPIPGTTSLTHLEENVAAGALELSEEDYAELEEVA
ncbi:MAG TPA: aldo/keto reductase [Gemmatimonadota bacterium]|nr:aldo/keto reductase [Gemmatimonadota bacterium]